MIVKAAQRLGAVVLKKGLEPTTDVYITQTNLKIIMLIERSQVLQDGKMFPCI